MKVLCFLPDTLSFQNKLGMLTRSAGVEFQPCVTIDEVKVFAAQEKNNNFFLFVDSRKADFLTDFSILFPNSKIIIILFDAIQRIAPQFIDTPNIECLVVTTNGEFDARELITLLKKLETQDFCGLEKHLGFPAIFNEKKVKNPQDKKIVLTLLEGFVLKLGDRSETYQQYAQRACDLADELITNAIFNANPRLRNESRDNIFELSDNEMIKIKWGFDGALFGMSVTDPFGSLTKETVLKYLSRKLNSTPFSSRVSASGVGIKLIFERLHHFIVNIKKDQKTEIICLMKFEKKFKDFDKRLKSFHYFKDESISK